MGDKKEIFSIKKTWKKVFFLLTYMALGSLLFLYIEQCYDVVKEKWSSLEKGFINLCNNITKFNYTTDNSTEPKGVLIYMKETCPQMYAIKSNNICKITFKCFCKLFGLTSSICLTIG